jgi:hypothetical protein
MLFGAPFLHGHAREHSPSRATYSPPRRVMTEDGPMKRAALLACLACMASAPVASAARQTTDQPDDKPGFQQVHVMYVLPSDGFDRGYDTDGTIDGSVAAWQTWFIGQTGGLGLNLDTADGYLDITFVRLAQSEATLAANGLFIRDAIEQQLEALGFDDPLKILAVYYDGAAHEVCGGGAWPPTLPGTVAAEYLLGTFADPLTPPCDSSPWAPAAGPPGYREMAMIHEIIHTMGFVPTCAPHHTLAGHVSDDPSDLMYAGGLPWQPTTLDVGRDDYFRTAPVAGCADLSKAAFVEPNGAPTPIVPGPAPDPLPSPSPQPAPAAAPSLEPAPAPQALSTPSVPLGCRVPRVVGLKRAAAVKRLRAAGCRAAKVTTRKARSRSERRRIGRVVSQQPKAGKRAAAGAQPRLVVLRR